MLNTSKLKQSTQMAMKLLELSFCPVLPSKNVWRSLDDMLPAQ